MKNHSLTRKLKLLFFLSNWLSFLFSTADKRRSRKSEVLLSPRLLKSKWTHTKNSLRKKTLNWNWDTRDNSSSIFNTNLDNRMLSYSTIFFYICSWYAIQCVIFLDVIARNSKNRSAKGNCKYNIMCGYKNWNPLFCEALHRRFEKSTFH